MAMAGKESGFYFFLNEKRPLWWRSYEELLNKCIADWKKLSLKDKQKYKNLAVVKYDNRGTSLGELKRDANFEKRKKWQSEASTKDLILKLKSDGTLQDHTFFVICFTYYGKHESTPIPAELTICGFSLKDGIKDKFHRIIPANLPGGMRYEVMQHCSGSHKLPLKLPPEMVEEAYNYDLDVLPYLYSHSLKPMKLGENHHPTLYTPSEFRESVLYMVEDFEVEAPLEVCSMELLFNHLHRAVTGEGLVQAKATQLLSTSGYEFLTSLACSYHQGTLPEGCSSCSSTLAQCWVFNMFNNLRLDETLGIRRVIKKHFPDEVTTQLKDMNLGDDTPAGAFARRRLEGACGGFEDLKG